MPYICKYYLSVTESFSIWNGKVLVRLSWLWLYDCLRILRIRNNIKWTVDGKCQSKRRPKCSYNCCMVFWFTPLYICFSYLSQILNAFYVPNLFLLSRFLAILVWVFRISRLCRPVINIATAYLWCHWLIWICVMHNNDICSLVDILYMYINCRVRSEVVIYPVGRKHVSLHCAHCKWHFLIRDLLVVCILLL